MSEFSQEQIDMFQKWFKDCEKWKKENGISNNDIQRRMNHMREQMDSELDRIVRDILRMNPHNPCNAEPIMDDKTSSTFWGTSWNIPENSNDDDDDQDYNDSQLDAWRYIVSDFEFKKPPRVNWWGMETSSGKTEQEERNEAFEKWLDSLPERKVS